MCASPDVVAQDLDDGLVLLNLRTGIYWGLNRTGAVIWRGIERRTGFDEMCRQLGEESDAPREEIAVAVRELLSELAEQRLIVEAAAEAQGAPQSTQDIGRRSQPAKKSAAVKKPRKKTGK